MPLFRDDSRWPIVVDGPSAPLTDSDVQRYNEARAERLARAERHVQVMDGRNGVRISQNHRRAIATFDLENRDAQRRYLAGVALVARSAALRLLLTAIYRLTPSVCPRKACASLEEATSWAQSILSSHSANIS
jgi:broad specificity phosphatase PhoE